MPKYIHTHKHAFMYHECVCVCVCVCHLILSAFQQDIIHSLWRRKQAERIKKLTQGHTAGKPSIHNSSPWF